MPKVIDKRKILGGRGTVVLYASGTSAGQYFYREYVGNDSYKTRRIPDATTMDQACELAVEIAFKFNKQPDLSFVFQGEGKKQATKQRKAVRVSERKRRKQLVKNAIDSYLVKEQERVDAGLIVQSHFNRKRNGLANHLASYFESKNILYTSEIRQDTFTDYPVFRSVATPVVRKQEVKWIKEWCLNYLVANRLMDSDLLLNRNFIPKVIVKQTDLMKNPAINATDWDIIVDFVRDDWMKRPLKEWNKSGYFFRNLFHHFILFAKNTGMSPEEIIKLKWKQIEIIDEGRTTSSGEEASWEISYIRTIRSKTQQPREIPANQARELRRWKKFVQKYIADKGLKDPRSPFEPLKITRDTLVFSHPKYGFRPTSHTNLGKWWREIREELADQLSGHRFSPHPYTLYSLRSTFIEDHLLKGTPVIEVAQMAGHSIVETQRSYARLNLRQKGREIATPEFGKKQRSGGVVKDLFEEDEEN